MNFPLFCSISVSAAACMLFASAHPSIAVESPTEQATLTESTEPGKSLASVGAASSNQQGWKDAAAVSAIQSTLEKQLRVRYELVSTLGKIKTDSSTEALWRLVCDDPLSATATQCINYLQERKFDRALTEQQLEALLSRLTAVKALPAGSTALLLAKCKDNDPATRLAPVIARFAEEAENPTFDQDLLGAYISGTVFSLNEFVRSFESYDRPLTLKLLRQAVERAPDRKAQMWLTIAMGSIGDAAVSGKLKSILQIEKDASTRVIALRAYARLNNEAALPILQTYLNDTTITGHSCMRGPTCGLQIVAKDEIARIKAIAIKKAASTPKSN